MSYALIDNASLTAVQRLLGEAPSRSLDSVDGDIAALENVIEAVLFYDNIVCIDDYKEEFRDSRKRQFPFINFFGTDNLNLQRVTAIAETEAERFRPEIRGGEFADKDFRAFLDQLRMHLVCTWDLSSSVYYLTMKMLGSTDSMEFEKYGQLSAAIFGELTDSRETEGLSPFRNNYHLVDSVGNVINDGYRVRNAKHGDGKTGGLTDALRVFIAALNWIAFKTIYYTLAGRALHADSFLYPIRQPFQIHWMQKTGAYDARFAADLIRRLTDTSTATLDAILGGSKSYTVNLSVPFFSAWIVTRTGDVRILIEEALNLRDDPRFYKARSHLSELRYLLDNGESVPAVKGVNKLAKEIGSAFNKLRSDFQVEGPRTLPVRTLIQVYNLVGSLVGLPSVPQLDAQVPLPSFMARKQKGFGTLYRDIVRDLTDIPKLGRVRELLGAAVQIKDAQRAFSPKAEDPAFRSRHSKWKSPM